MKSFVLDGAKMTTLDDLYDEVQSVLCPKFKHFGRNWHAVRDVLRGGFLVYELDETVNITIINSKKMRKELAEGHYKRLIKILDKSENVSYILE